MTAQHILSRWERIAPVLHNAKTLRGGAKTFKPATLWLAMLYVANGPESKNITAAELAESIKTSDLTAKAILQLLEKNRLVQFVGERWTGAHPAKVWAASQQLFEVLGLQPQSTSQPIHA